MSGRLAQWRGESKAEAAVARQVITRGSKEWFAVKSFYEATGQGAQARVMEKCGDSYVVNAELQRDMNDWEKKNAGAVA